MEPLVIEGTKSTPDIHFDAANNLLQLKGQSYPENAAQFYQPIFAWIESFLEKSAGDEVKVVLEIVYFNSSSSKVLLDLMDTLEEAADDGKKVIVEWRYDQENDLAEEYGEEFKEDLEAVDFRMVPISE
ncbi:MAG: DUF1987 domain-containing protein [Magnetococcales bacterium]|nr:DUF1987 domain-containing protein [Magnetococcales bacterium]